MLGRDGSRYNSPGNESLLPGRNISLYNGKRDEADRIEQISKFKSGEKSIMVSTSAFGLGVDVSDISNVIILGLCRTLSDLVQQIGRGGRNGMFCIVDVFDVVGDRRFDHYKSQLTLEDAFEFRKVKDFVKSNDCRLRYLSNEMDYSSVSFCGACDICDPLEMDVSIHEQYIRNRLHTKSAAAYMGWILDAVAYFDGNNGVDRGGCLRMVNNVHIDRSVFLKLGYCPNCFFPMELFQVRFHVDDFVCLRRFTLGQMLAYFDVYDTEAVAHPDLGIMTFYISLAHKLMLQDGALGFRRRQEADAIDCNI
jgi:hypothetical protein